MPAILTNPDPRDQLAIIRAACQKALAAGAVVTTTPDLGIVCDGDEAPVCWETESQTPILSPLGAVLLVHQPQIPDAEKALIDVLGVSKLWIVGFEEGLTGGTPTARGPAVDLYNHGFVAGAEFRARWAAPRSRDREVTPVAGPSPVDPGKVIPQLLASLTIAEALDALADTVPGRGWDDEDKAEVIGTLRTHADLYRALKL